MKQIRVLTVVFDTELNGFEIPAFRGAVIAKAGKENVLFHHHVDEKKFLYKYPLIQYKTINKQPAIVCIEKGVDEIHHYFDSRDWDIDISNRTLKMKVAKLNLNKFTMQVWDKNFNYRIINWIALNSENYSKYKEFTRKEEQIPFLENILKANLISFAKGIDWTLEKEIKLIITGIIRTKWVTLKNQKLLGFDLNFSCNIFIPINIGLGKSVSIGYGVVKRQRNDEMGNQEKV